MGCDRTPKPVAAPAKIHLVATAYPLADIARQVGGGALQCDWIAEDGQSLDTSDPTPDARALVRGAEMVVTNGVGEEWAADGFDDPMRRNGIVRLDLLPSAQADAGTRQFWLDPTVAKEAAKEIADRLALKRPQQAADFRQRADHFAAEVDAITHEFAPQLAAIKGRNVLVLSGNYLALTHWAGLNEIKPVTGVALQLSDDDLAALRDAAHSSHAAALLLDITTPAAVRANLEQKLGVPVLAIESLGTSAGVGCNSYQKILRYNLEQLATIARIDAARPNEMQPR